MNDWYVYLIVFGIGGIICLIGQILIIKTKIPETNRIPRIEKTVTATLVT